MSAPVPDISIAGLAWSFAPALAVVWLMARWNGQGLGGTWALARMLAQLLLVGYVLVFLFDADHAGLVLAVLGGMLAAAAWIAIRPVADKDARTWGRALAATAAGGLTTLALVTQVVVPVEPWYLPRYVLPLAGMMLSSAMNAVSLAAERWAAECGRGAAPEAARATAFNAAMIPVVNSLLAVGVVALPGMMTGQILSGVSPVLAAKYQIVIMATLFAASGIAAAVYLALAARACRGPGATP